MCVCKQAARWSGLVGLWWVIVIVCVACVCAGDSLFWAGVRVCVSRWLTDLGLCVCVQATRWFGPVCVCVCVYVCVQVARWSGLLVGVCVCWCVCVCVWVCICAGGSLV